jgi:hypothetical protein
MDADNYPLFQPGATYVTSKAFTAPRHSFAAGERLVFVRGADDDAIGYFFKDGSGRDRAWDIRMGEYEAVKARIGEWFVPA